MRKIKFRGYSKEINKWIYGNLIQSGSKFYIAKQEQIGIYECFGIYTNVFGFKEYENIFKIEPTSIGQYTGIKDKNGKEIYEGDIILYERMPQKQDICLVEFDDEYICGFKAYPINMPNCNPFRLGKDIEEFVEIIGNAYDNPKLLKG